MSIADWTFDASSAALADMIVAAVNDPDVRVVDGYPGDGDTGHQHIYVAGVSRADRAPYTTHGPSHENYELLLAIRVVTFTTPRDSRSRATELLNMVTAAIADDPRLTSTVSNAELRDVDSVTTRPTQDGGYTDIVARVTVKTLRA